MNEFEVILKIKAKTEMPIEPELMDMISKSFAEGAEMNKDESVDVPSITYSYSAKLNGEGEITFAKEEPVQEGLDFAG